MSRHIIRTCHEGLPVMVIAGYDRPLRELFLHVIREASGSAPTEAAETFVYDSLDEPQKDWTDINTVTDALTRLGIEVPQNMIEQICLDQCFNVGNRVVEHPAAEADKLHPPGPAPHPAPPIARFGCLDGPFPPCGPATFLPPRCSPRRLSFSFNAGCHTQKPLVERVGGRACAAHMLAERSRRIMTSSSLSARDRRRPAGASAAPLLPPLCLPKR